MSVEIPAGAGQEPESPQMAESKSWSAPGVRILVTGVALLLAATEPTAGCRCATTPTRSPSARRTRSRPGSGRPE